MLAWGQKESPAKRGRAQSNREVMVIVYHGIRPARIDLNQMSWNHGFLVTIGGCARLTGGKARATVPPWHLVFGTTETFACCLGRPP